MKVCFTFYQKNIEGDKRRSFRVLGCIKMQLRTASATENTALLSRTRKIRRNFMSKMFRNFKEERKQDSRAFFKDKDAKKKCSH